MICGQVSDNGADNVTEVCVNSLKYSTQLYPNTPTFNQVIKLSVCCIGEAYSVPA